MVVAVVGDVQPAEVVPLVEKLLRPPARRAPKPEPLRTVEPPQIAERQVVLRGRRAALLRGGLPPARLARIRTTPSTTSSATCSSSGRTSRLYRSLVRDKKIAAGAAGLQRLPRRQVSRTSSPFFGVPTPATRPTRCSDAIRAEIERLKNEDVPADELRMVKTRAKAEPHPRGSDNNSGLALQLAISQTRYGDWRELFREVDRIDKVTAADIRRVADDTFVDANRTVGMIESTPDGARPQGRQASDDCVAHTSRWSRLLLAAGARCLAQATRLEGHREAAAAAVRSRSSRSAIALPNGMVIFLQEDHELPLVRGTAHDPRRIARGARRQGRACSASTARPGAPAARRRAPATSSTTSSSARRHASRPAPDIDSTAVSLRQR